MKNFNNKNQNSVKSKGQKKWLWIIIFLFSTICLVPLVFFLLNYYRLQPQSKRLQPLPQDLLVQVYMNNAQSSEYSELDSGQTRLGDDLEKQIINTIRGAKFSVDVAIQELRLPRVVQALVEKQKAGVKVRVILENNYSRPWSSFTSQEVAKFDKREQERYEDFRKFADINRDGEISTEESNQKDALVILRNGNIPWIDDTADGSKGSGLMHHKFLVVDNRFVIVTSANWTFSDIHGDISNPDSFGNANNLLAIDSPDLAKIFQEEFNIMWGDGQGGKGDSRFGLKKPQRSPQKVTLGNNQITVNFSPISPTQPWSNSTNGLIGEVLESATKSVDMALFVFSEQRLANILETRHQQNVKLRALIEKTFAFRPYSEGLDMMGFALSNNCKYELDNRPWRNPITTVAAPVLPRGDVLHHKFAVVDNKTVITGSHNWSEAANANNDETLIVVENATVAAHYLREFERLYTKATPGIPERIQAKLKAEQQQCKQIQAPSSIISNNSKININTANAEELETLPGVGKKMAQRIISMRQQQKFTSVEDLDRVPGIGDKMLDKLRDKVTF